MSSSPAQPRKASQQCPRGPKTQLPTPLQEMSMKCCPRLLGMGPASRIEPKNKTTNRARQVLENCLPPDCLPFS